MSIVRVVPRVQPSVVEKTIRELLDDMDLIHIDSNLMQRLFDAWEQDRVDDWLISILDGSGLATPFVQAKVSKVLEWLNIELEKNPENESLLHSIKVFQDIRNKGREWVLLDGQHRYNYLGCWIRPQNEDERHIPNRAELDEFFARQIEDTTKFETEEIAGQRFCDLPDQIQEDILNTKFFVVVYESGDLRLIQQVFRVVNSSEKPRNMEVYMISLSPVVEFLRNVMNPTATSGSPHIRTFYEAALAGERNPDRKIGHKGAQLMIARFAGYLTRDKYPNWHDWQDTQKICDYDREVSLTTLNHIVDLLNDLSETFLTYHNHLSGAKVTPIKFIEGQNANWSNIFNMLIFYHNLYKGKYGYLQNLKKYARIEDKRQFVSECYRMIQVITAETDFIYVDRQGRNTPNIKEAQYIQVNGIDTPVFAEVTRTIDGKTTTEKLTNPHGFRGHNQVNKTKQFNQRSDMMEKYFNKVADDWIAKGVIKLVDKQRGASAKKSNFNGAVVQNYTDANTGEKITPYQLATKDNLVDSHFGENYVDGGTETLVGNKQVNAKMGTKKMQPKLEGAK